MAAAPAPIDVWLVFVEGEQDYPLQCYRQLLAPDERAREARFHFEKDRRRFVITRALVRTVLSRYAPVSPADWIFRANAYGRPEAANTDPAVKDLRFNVSHTTGLIALAVTRGRELGIDAEDIRRPAGLEAAEHFFSRDEARALRALPPDAQRQRFFEYWTLKEAYVKARGMGLSIPLDRFGFHLPHPGRVQFVAPPDTGLPSCWTFWQFQPSADYLVALCVEGTPDGQGPLDVRRVVPLGQEAPWPVRMLRTSDDGPELTAI